MPPLFDVQANLSLSDPDSSDGLANSGSSSYSSNSSSGTVPSKPMRRHGERLFSKFYIYISLVNHLIKVFL